ncbi:fungal specific transcription factor [Pochonia chlamydosporia 170]|uniref:Fungal specific transcription factor n=1 Tax=Pochonia chlamydosporia 170 TaxID=1380566 RepID=A0A179FNT4_METCM|nr:fungal specific transcription factor [Pochonia chlamydosporia 170]OAQ67244.2 fungal specific transcription factor [Pochonia chlamydosporia 170]
MDEYNVKDAWQQPKSLWHIRSRISNACDNCKARKTKCDGNLPCGCCIVRRPPEGCRYSPHQRRKKKADRLVSAKVDGSLGGRTPGDTTADGKGFSSDMASVVIGEKPVEDAIESSAEDDTDVPLEARLLCDDQGKLIFIGDRAPWSFFQSVRQLMTCCLGQHSFAPETSHLALENMPAGHVAAARGIGRCRNPPPTNDIDTEAAIANYLVATTSLVDLFDISKLLEDLHPWAAMEHKSDELASINNYLVLAIGTPRNLRIWLPRSSKSRDVARPLGELGEPCRCVSRG